MNTSAAIMRIGYRVLYALLAGSGLRIGEALAIRLEPQSDDCSTISQDCSTIYIRQAVWRGKEQDPKTDATVRDVDLPKELAALLSESMVEHSAVNRELQIQ